MRTRRRQTRAGASFGSVMTGLVVSVGSMMLIGIAAGVTAYRLGIGAEDVEGASFATSIALGAAALIIQFLSYMWGGYTAGRMGRGSGALNGFLVTSVGLLLGGLFALATVLTGAVEGSQIPFPSELPFGGSDITRFGTMMGLASMAVMFLGGVLGGSLGERWHRALESRTEPNRTIDLRDQRAHEPTRT